ncbi:MAG: hypothetical protein ACFWUL_06670 [Dialister sp.]|jgi:hypothetical protein
MDFPGPLGISIHVVCTQNEVKVPTVFFFTGCTEWCGVQPCIVSAAGDTGYIAEIFDVEPIPRRLRSFVDDFKYTGGVIHEHCTYFLEIPTDVIFFKNSTCCCRYSTLLSRRLRGSCPLTAAGPLEGPGGLRPSWNSPYLAYSSLMC